MFAGDFISKIIVPHPALNFPKNITLTYQVYRGWLTRGLSSWSISKVILGDSFGESYSLCKQLTLESGRPQRVLLMPGDCHEEELFLLAEKATKDAAAKIESTAKNSTEIFKTFNITADVMSLGKHIPLERNETESVRATETSNASWTPMLTTDITQPASNDSSDMTDAKFLNTGETFEPKKAKTEKRSFGESGEDDFMNSVPIRDDSAGVEEPMSIDDEIAMMEENIDNKFVTVQLFQHRLGDVFEKAEKYARFTLFPLLSEQISNIFNFDAAEKELTNTDSPIVIKSPSKKLRKFDINEEVDVRSLQSMLSSGLKLNDHLKPIEKIYNNYEAKDEPDMKAAESAVRVDLPTYRPPEKEKVFIPIDRTS